LSRYVLDMTDIIIIETNGTVKQSKVKDLTFETLYKKAGFRADTNFKKRTTWKTTIANENIIIELWAKDEGKANFENKYDFPPPVDKALYFGICILIRVDLNGNIIGLTSELWKTVYEKLFGGFEDIDEDEECSDDELENVDKKLKTKHGYLKDGFVVDEPVSEEDDDYSDEDEDEDDEDGGSKNDEVEEAEEDYDDDLEGSELEEDEYDYSDDEEIKN
jgi:hypothetical protein